MNIIHEWTLFSRLQQLPGESLTSFSSRLHAGAEKCSFDKKPEHIRDHLGAHMTDLEVSKKLQLKDAQNLTLADVLSARRQHEIVETQLATQRPEAAIAAFSSRPNPAPQRHTGNSRTPGTPSSVSKSSCSGCGSSDVVTSDVTVLHIYMYAHGDSSAVRAVAKATTRVFADNPRSRTQPNRLRMVLQLHVRV